MIINKKVKIVLNSSNINHYKEMKYIGNVGDFIEIDVAHLTKGSHTLIDVRCDYCGKEKKIEYNSLFKRNYLEEYCCKTCKNKINLTKKYGVENVFQLSDVKEKSKKTLFELYGVKNISQNEKIKKIKIETCLSNFGTEYPLSSTIIKEKSKETLRKKYGVDNISKVNEIKIKKEETCLKNYGFKYISQSDFLKKRIKNNIIEYLKEKYNIIDYNDNEYKFFCNKCDKEFSINKKAFFTRYNLGVDVCIYCNPIGSFSISGEEKKLFEFLEENIDFEIIRNKKIISPYELDAYIPELKLGFEFNGLYWHSEIFKNNKYHLNKTEECDKLGIKLIHIYEDDWIFKKDIIKSIILNSIKKTPNKIFARKCEIKEILDNKIVKEFLEKNHLQGFVGSKVKIGLFYDEELVSLMTFGLYRKSMGQKRKENSFEMLRFCNKLNTNVVGGASRLFKYFIENHNPSEITSYANRSWSSGNLYKNLGFHFLYNTKPNYYYIINKRRKYRFGFRKDILVKEGFDSIKTEKEIMLERDIYRIYDSGNSKFLWEKSNIIK